MSSGVGFIGWIIIGAIAGWIAEKIMKRDHGLLTNIIVGIVGGLLGGFLLSLVGLGDGGFIWTLLTAILGACVLLAIVGMVTRGSAR